METGQPPNLTTITKKVSASLNLWITVLTSTDTGWQLGSWAVHICLKNSAGESGYVLPGKRVIVPTPTPRPPPHHPHPLEREPVTHVWTFDSYTGCGPDRKKVKECSNGHARYTRQTNAAEPLIWDEWKNVGSSEIVYGSSSNVGSPRLISGVCKHGKERSWTRSQRQESENQCGGTKYQTITTEGTEFNYDTVTETWGNWTDTGNTRENELDYSIEKEQERFSSPCNRRETSWVAA